MPTLGFVVSKLNACSYVDNMSNLFGVGIMGLGLSKSHLCVTVWTVWLALLGTALTFGSASAADFSGDCCADLEERVAELEATTVRKGNKKVTVTISGWVTKFS